MRRHLSQVNDWMSRNPITCSPGMSLAGAYGLMLENDIRRLVVMAHGEVVGIITLSDILRVLPGLADESDEATRLLQVTRKVADVMTSDPICIDPEETIQEAAEQMLEYQISGLPVVTGDQLVGIITESDIFRLVVESWSDEPVA
jgi:acetoin utilization protein AcuB